MNWNKVGVARTGEKLTEAIEEVEEIRKETDKVSLKGSKAYNMVWNDWMALQNMIDISALGSGSAILREETRGAHYREDYPEQDDNYGLFNIVAIKGDDGKPVFEKKPVVLKHKKPSDLKK